MTDYERKELALMILRLALLIAAIALLIWVNAYFSFVILAIVVWIVIDVVIGLKTKKCPSQPPKDAKQTPAKYHINDIIWHLENPGLTNPEINFTLDDVTEQDLLDSLDSYCSYIKARYDCLDFRATVLYRLVANGGEFIDKVSPSGKVRALLDETFLGMKFWMTEKGDDSVCYFSENHEITFFILAYLFGRMYSDRVFVSDGRTGAEKVPEARERMITWFKLRGKYGFSEFYSHNYLPIDFASISLLLMYGDRTDRELMDRAKGVMDILCLDYAHSYAFGTTIGAMGRAYARNNINCAFRENTTDLVTDAIWNDCKKFGGIYYHKPSQVGAFQRLMSIKDENGEPYYVVPEAIKAIGKDTSTQVIRTSFGLDLKDIQKEGLLGLDDRQVMFQFGMVAMSNPEIINNSFDFVNEYSLISNEFFSSFKYFNISLLRFLGVFPLISRVLKIYPNGVALQRSNVYIYRTKDYKLSTLVGYHPGSAGAQQTTMMLLLPGGISNSTTHSGTQVLTRSAKNYGSSTSHIFETMITATFRNYRGSRIAHAEAFACNTVDKCTTACGSKKCYVTYDNVIVCFACKISRLFYNNLSTAQTFTKGIVCVSCKTECKSLWNKSTKALTGTAFEVYTESVVCKSVAKLLLDFRTKNCSYRSVG